MTNAEMPAIGNFDANDFTFASPMTGASVFQISERAPCRMPPRLVIGFHRKPRWRVQARSQAIPNIEPKGFLT